MKNRTWWAGSLVVVVACTGPAHDPGTPQGDLGDAVDPDEAGYAVDAPTGARPSAPEASDPTIDPPLDPPDPVEPELPVLTGTVDGGVDPNDPRDEFLVPFEMPTLPNAPALADLPDTWARMQDSIDDGLERVRDLTDEVIAARLAAAPSLVWGTQVLPSCPAGAAAFANGQPYGTVRAASDAVAPYGVVLVCPGTHATQISFRADNVGGRVLAPVFPFTRPTLTGVGDEEIVHGSWAPHLALLGLDLADARVGVSTSWGGTLVLAGNRFRGMRQMAAFTSWDSEWVVAIGNEVDGGGVSEQGLKLDALDLLFLANDLHDHHGRGDGGGAALYAHQGVVVANRFAGNHTVRSGGALELYHETHDALSVPRVTASDVLAVVGNTFERNTADFGGGAVMLGIRYTPVQTWFVGNVFVDNDARDEGNGMKCGSGGGFANLIGERFVGSGGQAEALDFGGLTPITPTLVGVSFQ